MAHIEGTLVFKVVVDDDGVATDFTFESGHPLLHGAVTEALNHWRFPKDSAGKQIEATVQFTLNCPSQPK